MFKIGDENYFIGLRFRTVATSDYNKIASDEHTIEASTLF